MAQKLIDRRTLGLRLHMLRFTRRWSNPVLESRSGIPRGTLRRWERAEGESYPPLDRLAILADVYGVELSELLDPDFDTRAWFNGRTQASQA